VQQLPEIILIDDVLHTLYTTPLLPWLRGQDPPLVFDRRTPSCERGYVGSWTIRDGVLLLTGVYAWRNGELTMLPDLFGSKREVVADWFTGPLVVEPAASEIPRGAAPKLSTVFIEAGRVVETQDRPADDSRGQIS
jgi:hypothetical protein